MGNNAVRIPQLAWFGDTELELTFPSNWDVVVRTNVGWDRPALGDDAIWAALARPIGTPPLHELAKGSKEVVIIFDDMTRPTPTSRLVPFVLEELAKAGIKDEQIRFVMATGNHAAGTLMDFVKKLGAEVLERFPVYNHNCYDNCVKVGETSTGIPVAINAEVMHCDLRIGIGSIVPHPRMGYGGGAKLMIPGVASIETVAANHGVGFGHHTPAYGSVQRTTWRQGIEEMARIAGFHFKVDMLLNGRRQPTAVFAGDPIEEWTTGAKVASEHYATVPVEDADIVIANSYSKASEASVAIWAGSYMTKKNIDLVNIVNTPTGQVVHYLSGAFGKSIGGRLAKEHASLPAGVDRLLVLSPYPDRAAAHHFGPSGGVTFFKRWDELLKELKVSHPGEAKVAVYPDRTAQFFPAALNG